MNTSLKKSRQRDAIMECVMAHHDHPTADIIYQEVRNSFPNISLGTVYRNLSLLTNLGRIRKITCGDNADHFDGNYAPHAHFFCTKCGCLKDLPEDMEPVVHIPNVEQLKDKITEKSVLLFGECEDCLSSEHSSVTN